MSSSCCSGSTSSFDTTVYLEGTGQERAHRSERQHAAARPRDRQAGQERDRAAKAPRHNSAPSELAIGKATCEPRYRCGRDRLRRRRGRPRGRMLVGEPFFTPGRPIPLDRRGWATSARRPRGRRGGAAARASSACSGRPTRSRPCSRACSSTRALGHEFEPYDPPEPTPRGARRPARAARRSRSTPRPRRTSTTRSRAARGRRDARLGAHRRRLAVRAGRLAARPRRGRTGALRRTSRASSRRCSRTSSPTTLCSLRPNVDRLCVTVEVPFDGSSRRASRFLPLGDPQRERLTYGQARGDPGGTRAASRGARGGPGLAETVALELRAGASPRRSAARRRSSPSSSTARAASRTRGARASRMRTRSSRS